MGIFRKETDESRAAHKGAVKAVEDVNAKARAQGRKFHDDADAAVVQQIRSRGGSSRAQERQVTKYLKGRGY